MRRQMLVAALIGTLALVGCGTQGVQLDREVDIEGLILSVPSTWVEDGNDYGLDSLDSSFGSRTFSESDMEDGDPQNIIVVSYSNDDHEISPDEYAEDYFGDMDATKESELVIDGAECVVYDVPANDLNMKVAFILDMDMTYEITVLGNDVDMDDVLETVSVA